MKVIYNDGHVAECPEDEELHVIRHTAAHILAQAVKRLYPDAHFAYGPATEKGFYYDVDLGDKKLSDEDLPAIEAEMAKIVKENLPIKPFVLSREIPFAVDAIFEAASGFTTTGATILGDVEALSHASMLWRCLMHWVGGMGVLVFMLIVLPLAGGQTIFLMRAESPGPSVSKMSPRMRDTATILYAIYFGLTVLQMILLLIGAVGLFGYAFVRWWTGC